MLLKDFILKTSDMVDSENKTPVLDWIEFACDMADSCGSRMEQELDDIFRSLCYVKNNFCPETFQESLRILCLSNEIIYGAMFSDAGVAPETIRKLADDGVLECGYIPADTWELASLSLIQMEEPESMLWIVENEESLRIYSSALLFRPDRNRFRSRSFWTIRSCGYRKSEMKIWPRHF